MGDKTFNTRISLKYDLYQNWVDNDPVLLSGELGIVVVPGETGAVANEPTVLFKVGDGSKKFSELQFVAGLAADVYSWAKAETKPTYSAGEITGLDDYISGQIKDTNTQYKIEVDSENPRKFTLSAKEIDGDWSVQNTITIPDETVYTLVEGTANGTVKFNGTDVPVHGLGSAAYTDASAYETAGAAAQALSDAKSYADTKDTAIAEAKQAGEDAKASVESLSSRVDGIDGRVSTAEGTITTLVGSDSGKSVRTIANEELAAQLIPEDAQESLNTLAEIAAWIQEHPDDAATMNADIAAIKTQLTGIGPESGAVKTYVDGAIAALNIGDYAKASELAALAARVGNVEGSAHTHTNKDTLDSITPEKVSTWDSKADGAHTHEIKDLNQTSGYIVFNCGSATVNI